MMYVEAQSSGLWKVSMNVDAYANHTPQQQTGETKQRSLSKRVLVHVSLCSVDVDDAITSTRAQVRFNFFV